MAPMSPVPAARSVSSRMRSFSPAVNVRRLGRNSGLAAAGAGTTVGLRPSSVPAPAAAFVSATLLGMTTRQFSCALKSKLPGRLCLIIIGTEGFGDKGYIGRKLAEDLLRRGLTLFTRVRRNMKALPLSLQDKALLNARNLAETIIGHIKEFSSLNLSKHRSVINAFVHIIAAITAYQINPIKPKLNLQTRYQLETTA